MMYRIAFLFSHPIQYHAPFVQKLAARQDLEVSVYYCSDYGVSGEIDSGFGVPVKWDRPVLEGYHAIFLRNYSPFTTSPNWFLGVWNPGIIIELMKHRYDAVIVPGYALSTYWLAYAGAWLSGTPVFFRGETVLRGHQPWWKRLVKSALLTPLFHGTAAFLSIGSGSRALYRSYGVPERKIFLVPYAVDNDFFIGEARRLTKEKPELKRSLGAESQMVVLFSGKLIEKKRPFDLLRAYEQMECKKKTLVFLGDGELRHELERYAHERRIPRVHFVGFKNQTELPRYYAASDIFVLPSDAGETWGLVVNEAMCFSLPIVVSDAVGCARDLVENGVNGYRVRCGDIEELSRKLDELCRDETNRIKMGEQSLQKIMHWSYDAGIQNILSALRETSR